MKIIVNNLDTKCRIDAFLAKELKKLYLSRNAISSLIKENKVYINNINNIKNSTILKNDDIIEINDEYLTEENKKSEKPINKNAKHIKVIFENDNFFIINKPKNLTVHEGAGTKDELTLSEILLDQFNNKLSTLRGEERSGIVHRLDKDTTGLMIIAKNNKAHYLLSEMIKNREMEKRYLALCHGLPIPTSGTIQNFIQRDSKDIKKMIITNKNDKSKEAITYYQLKQVINNGEYSIIECNLLTGRTHQIRLHMLSIKHPIVGDIVYKNDRCIKNKKSHELFIKKYEITSQCLHSYYLKFNDPFSGELIEIENCDGFGFI